MKRPPQQRLFIAIDPPEALRTAFAAESRRLPSASGLAWTVPGQLHLTLRFLGETDEITAATVRGGLERVAFAPFRMVTSGIGFFPGERDPRVLWLGVNHDERLLVFKAQIDKLLAARGFPRENRRFTPHLTLARIHEELAPEMLPQLRDLRLSGQGMVVDRFHLYASELTPTGALHTVLQTYAAQAAPIS